MRCKNCKEKFEPKFFNMKYCEKEQCRTEMIRITLEKQRINNEKKRRKNTKEQKEELKSLSDHLNETQVLFNKFIRERDFKDVCISCLKDHKGQYHAGHYKTVGSSPELRFNELNCHKQCSVCNNHKHGNLIDYRINLIKKIGAEAVESLEGYNQTRKYTVHELKELQAYYKSEIKKLKKENDDFKLFTDS